MVQKIGSLNTSRKLIVNAVNRTDIQTAMNGIQNVAIDAISLFVSVLIYIRLLTQKGLLRKKTEHYCLAL